MSKGEERRRREAVRRRLAGEPVGEIARTVGRSRQWVARWVRRYEPADPDWASERSRAARTVANRTPAAVEAQVLEVRERLVAHPWAQIGAEAIAWELEKLGIDAPTTRTIERILQPLRGGGAPAARAGAGEGPALSHSAVRGGRRSAPG